MSADQYASAVEAQLIDLPWRRRKDLVADLRVHLAEVLPGEDLAARLGSPESYASELRTAAGLASRRGLLAFVRARRPRNVVIAVLLAALAGAIVAASTWASHYQPLATGSNWMNPVGARSGALEESIVTFRPGAPFQLGFSIRNDGRFPVRIVDVPLEGFTYPFVARAFVMPWSPAVFTFHAPGRRIGPFTLSPGDERLISLRGRYRTCATYEVAPGSSITVVSLPVRVRFRLWTRTVHIRLASPLVIRGPAHNPCRQGR